jgi:hypothetical protein
MSPADKIKLTNMVDQSVSHTLDRLGITDPKEMLNQYELACVLIVHYADQVDQAAVQEVLNNFLDKKANKLGVNREQKTET